MAGRDWRSRPDRRREPPAGARCRDDGAATHQPEKALHPSAAACHTLAAPEQPHPKPYGVVGSTGRKLLGDAIVRVFEEKSVSTLFD